MRVLIVVSLLLLVAASQAQLFDIVPSKSSGSSVVYGVQGVVTVGTPTLTSEKSALQYKGEVAIQQISNAGNSEVLVAQFKSFQVQKYDSLRKTVEDESWESSEESAEKENTDYLREVRKPVKFYLKDGEVVRYEAQKDQKEWAINIYRAVFTLFQNQVEEPKSVDSPKIEYYYEDGVSGNCKVQYEVLSQPEPFHHSDHVFNMTKTKFFRDCKEPRPVYLHLKETTRGCPGVCSKHQPENFMPEYKEEKSDHEMNPSPGCPMNRRPTDTLVTVHEISQYNISQRHLEEAQVDTLDIYKLYAGSLEVRTRLSIEWKTSQGQQVQQPTGQLEQYTSLHQHLPEEAEHMDIPIYALMLQHGKTNVVEAFNRHLTQAVKELQQFDQQTTDEQPENVAHYVIHMVQAMSFMTAEQIRRTIPQSVQQKKQTLQHKEQVERQLWLDVLSKGGSTSAVKVAVELIKKQQLTQSESRRVLQSITAFQSYSDKDMIEEVMELCLDTQNKLSPAAQATACVATGKIIAKACRSAVHFEPFTPKMQQQSEKRGNQQKESSSSEESQEESMSRLVLDEQKRCNTQDLNKYIQRISKALHESKDFKEVVAFLNGLSKIAKPEVLPELQEYVEGTAKNLKHIVEKDENEEEAIDFIRQIALLSLHNVAEKYPKEVNPMVRVIFLNVSETVQTRTLAFDVWLQSEPAQWEVKKVLQFAKDDESIQLRNYIYTALKHISRSEEPCNQLFARRIQDAWTAIRPFDIGMENSHFYAGSYYDNVRDYGTRAIWKLVSSNSSHIPTYSSFEHEFNRGPYQRTEFSAKLLIKGAEQFKRDIVGNDGLLDRLADAIDAKLRQGSRKEEQQHLFKDIAKDIKFEDRDTETPKAVLLWKFFSGEAILPIDAEYVEELKAEFLQHVFKWGKEGINAHIVRIIMPTKAFHVEPSSVGFPIVHYTIHPIVVSIRLQNVQLKYDNVDNRFIPETLEIKGIFHPTILSLRESRIFVADVEGEQSPSTIVTSIKEFNFKAEISVKHDIEEHRLKLKVKPFFDRVAHVAHCVQITLDENFAIDEQPSQDWIDYNNCVDTMPVPFRLQKEYFGKHLGWTLFVNGTSHKPWSGLSFFGNRKHRQYGFVAAFLEKIANQGLKQHIFSAYLKPYKQNPINEWSVTFDLDDNIDHLARQHGEVKRQQRSPLSVLSKQLFEDSDSSSSSSSSSESSEAIEKHQGMQNLFAKLERLIKKENDHIDETTYEKQLSILTEGFYQGQPKKTYKAALRKISTFDKTEQQYAFVFESQESQKRLEIYGNVSYPNIDTPFNFEPAYLDGDEMNATFVVQYYGKNQQGEKFIVEFNATKSEEQREGIQDYAGRPYNKWFQVRCLAEQRNGHDVSDACRRANLVDNYLDQMQLTVTYPKNVSPRLQQAAQHFLTFIKYKYHAHSNSEITRLTTDLEHQFVVSANATRVSPWYVLYNVEFNMPEETLRLKHIRAKGFRPPHMQLSAKQQVKQVVFKTHKDYPCGLGERTIHTYDNVSFPLDVKTHCQYVLTRDCSGTPDFTVVFEVLDKTVNSKKLQVQLFNTVIELTPPEYQHEIKATVTINGTVHHIVPSTPLTFFYAKNYKVFVYVVEPQSVHDRPIVYIRTENKKFNLHFDGFSAFVYVASHYRGDTCGICGNNDNEAAHEFIGPHGEEYEHSNEFIASYGVGAECQRPVHSTAQQLIEDLQEELEKESMNQIFHQQQMQKQWGQQKHIRQQGRHSDWSGESSERRQHWDSSEESQEHRQHQKRQQGRIQNKVTSSEEEQQWRQRQVRQNGQREPRILRQDSSEERKHSQQPTRSQQQKRQQHDSSEEQSAEEKQCFEERTILRNLPAQYCFSKRPVSTCSSKCRKVKGTKKEQVEFTCLPKEDPQAKKLVRLARQQGVIKEVHSMPVSIVESVRIPEKCVRL